MKALLVYICPSKERHDYYMSLMPHGLTSLAAAAEDAGHRVVLANFSHRGIRGAMKCIRDEKPSIVGLSLFSYNRVETLKLIKKIKREMPRVVLVVGGHHATALADEILERYTEIDHLVTGEGEAAWLELLDSLKAEQKLPRLVVGKRLKDLDKLPFPGAFTGKTIDVNPHEQYKMIISTRGCPNRCTFCASPDFWGRRVTFRSAENLADEIEFIHKNYGIIYFSIRDDNFTLKKDRVIRFARLLRERKLHLMWNCQARVDTIDGDMLREMKLAGLEHIQYGVESGSEPVLARLDKDITLEAVRRAAALTREAGIYLSIYLMTGLDGETMRDTKATIKLIREILPGDGLVSPVAYYPGTGLYEEMKKEGKVTDRDWFTSHETGLYVRDDSETRQMQQKLLDQLGLIRERSWYRPKDFKKHRNYMGEECWVTDILEGDCWLDMERIDEAKECFSAVIEQYPENVWGFLRMGKLCFLAEEYRESEAWYRRALESTPGYYGIYLKLTELALCRGNKQDAAAALKKAKNLNPFDPRIKNLKKLV